jgi:EpsI family protein
VREHLLARGSERRLVWSWYSIGGRTAASEVEGKAMTAWSLLLGQGDHACMLVIGVALELTDQRKADQAGLTQAREHLARLGRRLPCD